ncbi:MAG: HAD family hydrolase [Moraxellaceae bacterium]|nr:HAD family hydrolase [Moraxellaceae bacterium]MDZ4386598.1 HAD family hydrolase [Moraxellaceae bacterium]
MSSSIKLLTFDLDNTLWDVNTVVIKAEATMQSWLSSNYPQWLALGPQRLGELRQHIYTEQANIRHDLTALRKAVLLQLLQESGYSYTDALAGSNAAFDVFFQARNQVTFYDGVLPTLQALKNHHTLYALSNGNADIKRVGLSHVFAQHFSAASVGQAKPHPAMFEAALAHAGVGPEDVVHIGDHPEQDVAAAQALGIRSIWINYDDQHWPLAKPADAVVRHFEQIKDVLAQWR